MSAFHPLQTLLAAAIIPSAEQSAATAMHNEDPRHLSAAAQWGLLVAAGVAFGLFYFMLFAFGWSGAHCEPAPQCQRQVDRWFLIAAVGALVTSALLGLLVRSRLNAEAMREGEARPAPNWRNELLGLALLVTGLITLEWLDELLGLNIFQ